MIEIREVSPFVWIYQTPEGDNCTFYGTDLSLRGILGLLFPNTYVQTVTLTDHSYQAN